MNRIEIEDDPFMFEMTVQDIGNVQINAMLLAGEMEEAGKSDASEYQRMVASVERHAIPKEAVSKMTGPQKFAFGSTVLKRAGDLGNA